MFIEEELFLGDFLRHVNRQNLLTCVITSYYLDIVGA